MSQKAEETAGQCAERGFRRSVPAIEGLAIILTSTKLPLLAALENWLEGSRGLGAKWVWSSGLSGLTSLVFFMSVKDKANNCNEIKTLGQLEFTLL